MSQQHRELSIHSKTYEELNLASDQIYTFQAGILGISHIQQYALLPVNESDAFILHALEEDLSFILLPAHQVIDNYGFNIDEDTVQLLQINNPEDVITLLITNVDNGQLYVNLKAPVLLSPARIGCQFIITDQDFPIRHPLERKEEI